MLEKQTHDELLELAYLAEKQNLPQAAKWLHAFVVGAYEYPTLALFEYNIDGGDIQLQCLTKEGFFLPCYEFKIESALHERYRFPPLFRVTCAGHIVQSKEPSDLSTPQR